MRSRLEIVAQYRSGRTVLASIRGGGHYAARQTGEGVVHLVGTAAGPLGGDDVTIEVRVGPGAKLAVRSAGATIVQPGGQAPDSRLRLRLSVADGGELDVGCEPAVIIRAAQHEAATLVELSGSGRIALLEQVLLGRSGEPGGDWVGRLQVTRDGAPLLSHTVRSSLVGAAGVRVICSLLDSAAGATPATWGNAVAMPLAAGGMLVTATGTELMPTRRDLLAAALRARPAADPALSAPGRP